MINKHSHTLIARSLSNKSFKWVRCCHIWIGNWKQAITTKVLSHVFWCQKTKASCIHAFILPGSRAQVRAAPNWWLARRFEDWSNSCCNGTRLLLGQQQRCHHYSKIWYSWFMKGQVLPTGSHIYMMVSQRNNINHTTKTYTRLSNAVTLVWGSLGLTPIQTLKYACKVFGRPSVADRGTISIRNTSHSI